MLRPILGAENVLRAYVVLAVFILALVNLERPGRRRAVDRAEERDPEEAGRE